MDTAVRESVARLQTLGRPALVVTSFDGTVYVESTGPGGKLLSTLKGSVARSIQEHANEALSRSVLLRKASRGLLAPEPGR